MLVLSRYPGESIKIGADVTVTIERVRGEKVSISIEAPRKVQILRKELIEPRPRKGPADGRGVLR